MSQDLSPDGRHQVDRLAFFAFFVLRDFFADFFADFLAGTFFPSLRASERPIAMACFRLLTVLPDRPLFSVPFLRLCMARLTFFAAPLEYFRTMILSAVHDRTRISAEHMDMFHRTVERRQ
jgi:hypothetical protein